MAEPIVPSAAAPEPRKNLHSKLVDPETAPRPRIKELEVMVAEVIRDTPDTSTLVLFTGNDRLEYQPGHFLTIRPQQFPALDRFCKYFEDLKGRKEPARAYSLSSAPHERHLAVTVKEERYVSGLTKYPPLLSPLLVWRTLPGTRMVVTGFGGPYVPPPDLDSRTDHVVHICAGSGIVPNYSILKHCLGNCMKVRHTLIYGNKTWEDVIFRHQLEELARQHPDKLRIVHTLSREQRPASAGADVRQGRVSEALIREFIPDSTAVEVYACGPGVGKYERLAARERGEEPAPRFLESVLEALENLGVPDERIHRESYG
jgi:3-ketosteroid 9alpha-monooxygenase subunit B